MKNNDLLNLELDANKVLKEALKTYKQDERDVYKLLEAWQILSNIFPAVSTDHETLGLACSITRKLYEALPLYMFREKAERYVKRFFNFFKTNYSFSSSALYLVAATERNFYSFDTYKRRARKLLKDFLDQSKQQEGEDFYEHTHYYKHTLNLLKAMQGIKCEDYNLHDASSEALAYERAIQLHRKINLCNREYRKIW